MTRTGHEHLARPERVDQSFIDTQTIRRHHRELSPVSTLRTCDAAVVPRSRPHQLNLQRLVQVHCPGLGVPARIVDQNLSSEADSHVGVEVVDGEVVDGLVLDTMDCDVVDGEGYAGVVEEEVAGLEVFGVDPFAVVVDPEGVFVGGGDGVVVDGTSRPANR
jgi:hypothetical protein